MHSNFSKDDNLSETLNLYLKLEKETLEDYLNFLLEKKVTIGSSNALYINKLIQLSTAKKVGLDIPKTKILTNKKQFFNYFELNKTITKGIFNTFFFSSQNYSGSSAIKLINKTDIEKVTPNFKPSFFQTYIDKEIEIRSFYFKNEIYSMAIFSQNNKRTKVDFRNYDTNLPNRMVPIKLPKKIRIKLKKFMKNLKLDTGSFDLLFFENKFYFLEINTIGQFGFLSGNCNYNIEFINDIFYSVQNLLFYNCNNKEHFLVEETLTFIRKITTKVLSNKNCGNCSNKTFNLTLPHYLESLKYNNCLNKKLSIDLNGNIKNCPSLLNNYGNIEKGTLRKIVKSKDFQKLWNINKDKIDVCKICEFRYICTDCRAFVENPSNPLSKPLKCGYNPKTNVWDDWSTNILKKKTRDYYTTYVIKSS